MNVQNEYTALHWACEKGHAETADFLILSGTDIEALDKVSMYQQLEGNFLTF